MSRCRQNAPNEGLTESAEAVTIRHDQRRHQGILSIIKSSENGEHGAALGD
jgi:hypothetical protein